MTDPFRLWPLSVSGFSFSALLTLHRSAQQPDDAQHGEHHGAEQIDEWDLQNAVNEQPAGRFTVDNVGYIPTYTWKQDGAVKVLPSGRYLENRPTGMDDENYKRMVASYYEIAEVMGNQFQLING